MIAHECREVDKQRLTPPEEFPDRERRCFRRAGRIDLVGQAGGGLSRVLHIGSAFRFCCRNRLFMAQCFLTPAGWMVSPARTARTDHPPQKPLHLRTAAPRLVEALIRSGGPPPEPAVR